MGSERRIFDTVRRVAFLCHDDIINSPTRLWRGRFALLLAVTALRDAATDLVKWPRAARARCRYPRATVSKYVVHFMPGLHADAEGRGLILVLIRADAP